MCSAATVFPRFDRSGRAEAKTKGTLTVFKLRWDPVTEALCTDNGRSTRALVLSRYPERVQCRNQSSYIKDRLESEDRIANRAGFGILL